MGHAASGSEDKTVKIWNLETGECRVTLAGHTAEVKCVAITPDGKRVLSGADEDNTGCVGCDAGAKRRE
jgi:WD40 repeat protein